MITFIGGPADGAKLQIRRAPVMLRVVSARAGHWDALDQVEDVARTAERIYVYRLTALPRQIHIKASGKGGKALSGFWPIASYEFLDFQPDEVLIRNNENWVAWCDVNRDRLMPEWAKQSGVCK